MLQKAVHGFLFIDTIHYFFRRADSLILQTKHAFGVELPELLGIRSQPYAVLVAIRSDVTTATQDSIQHLAPRLQHAEMQHH